MEIKSKKVKDLLENVRSLTMQETKEFADALAEEYGVSSLQVAGSNAENSNNKQDDSKKTVSVVVKSFASEQKVKIIMLLRKYLTGKTLSELSALVVTPFTFKENISLSEAEEIKKQLVAIPGTVVEIK